MSADRRGWGLPPFSVQGGTLVRVNCSGILPMWVRPEVKPLFDELVIQIERITGPGFMTSSGGYNFRAKRRREEMWNRSIRQGKPDYSLLSEHAWGLAGDFRAGTNPGYANKTTDFPKETRQIAFDLGLSWGGTWTNPYDPMHFEWLGTVAGAVVACNKLRVRKLAEAVIMAEFTPEEKADIVRAAQVIIRTFDVRQESLVTKGEFYWIPELLRFIDRATNGTAKNTEELLRRVPPLK